MNNWWKNTTDSQLYCKNKWPKLTVEIEEIGILVN